jgi:hypothetical protein
MGTRAQKIRAQIAELQTELDVADTRKRLAAAQRLIGKCFKYRNCYSCPEKESDYWWLYVRVLSVDTDGYASGVSFQHDSRGHLEIKPEVSAWIDKNGGYVPITFLEWHAALSDFMARVEAMSELEIGAVYPKE